MALLTSNKAEGERTQFLTEFRRPIAGVGYSNMDNTGPSLSLRFDASEETDKSHRFGGRKPKMLGRTARLTLDEADLIKVVARLFNPDYTLGFVFDGGSNNPEDRLNTRVLEANGLFAEKYRHAWDHYSAKGGYMHVWALNPRHAEFQLQRLLKAEYDADKLQVAGEYFGGGESWHKAFPEAA